MREKRMKRKETKRFTRVEAREDATHEEACGITGIRIQLLRSSAKEPSREREKEEETENAERSDREKQRERG